MSARPAGESETRRLKAHIALGICIALFVASLIGAWDRQIDALVVWLGADRVTTTPLSYLSTLPDQELMTSMFRREHPVAFYVLSAVGAAVIAQTLVVIVSAVEFLIRLDRSESESIL